MIKLIKTNQKYAKDIIDDVKSGRIHVVCMAQNGLTNLNVYAELYFKLPKDIINKCVDHVNNKRETGTLYPNAHITILPKSEMIHKTSQPLTMEELKNCLKDVFIANEEYLKSEIIYFTLEESYVDRRSAKVIIKELIKEYHSLDTCVKTIWFEE